MNTTARVTLLFLFLSSIAVAEDLELTVARLTSISWGSHPDLESLEGVRLLGGLLIQFRADMSFSAVVGPGQGGEHTVAGRYAVDDNKLTLSRMTQAGLVPWLVDGVLKYKAEAYDYPYYYIDFADTFSSTGEKVFAPLPVNDHVLLDLTTTLTRGRSIQFDGVAAAVVNADGETTDVLNTRSAPSVQAERVVFETATGSRSSIPKGTEIRVLARTTVTDKVGNLENYWFYIEYWPDPSGPVNAWVFGEYVKVQ